MGQMIGGDMDDWIADTFKIPSVTNELGDMSLYNDEWEAKTDSIAYLIVSENYDWLEYTF
jgi:hypothetical protein